MTIIPRFIRAKEAPAYLGMDRNKFNRDIKPQLTVIELGKQSRAYDRLDLDAVADDIKSRNGRLPECLKGDAKWQQKERQGSRNVGISGMSTRKSRGTEDFAKALAAVTSKQQTGT